MLPLSEKTFWFCIFFLAGVGSASFGVGVGVAALSAAFLLCVLLVFWIVRTDVRFSVVALLFCVGFVGGFFYTHTMEYLRVGRFDVAYGSLASLRGTVASYPHKSGEGAQSFVIKTSSGARMLVYTDVSFVVGYGDEIACEGILKTPSEISSFVKREGVIVTLSFPSLTRIHQGHGVVRSLYELRDRFVRVFASSLPSDYASLASGILVGQEGAGFSADLSDAMRASGTTHLVALSGYNVSILVVGLVMFLGLFMRRRLALFGALLGLVFFVVMTGATASVVRAALMGSLLVVAEVFYRVYSFRHSMALAAFIMALANPLTLLYDAGFLLSFCALAGIVYIAPIINSFFDSGNKYVLGSISLAAQTIGAQLAVAGVLVSLFGGISLVGLFSNILILPIMPLTMLIGFGGGFLGMFLVPLRFVFMLPLLPLLWFEIFIIRLFGSVALLKMGGSVLWIILYYGILLGFVWWGRKRIVHTYGY